MHAGEKVFITSACDKLDAVFAKLKIRTRVHRACTRLCKLDLYLDVNVRFICQLECELYPAGVHLVNAHTLPRPTYINVLCTYMSRGHYNAFMIRVDLNLLSKYEHVINARNKTGSNI